jgi:hypothetical protein
MILSFTSSEKTLQDRTVSYQSFETVRFRGKVIAEQRNY